MDAFRRYKRLAAVVGIILTAGPLLWFSSWIQKQGVAEVTIVANLSIGAADLMIEEAASTLDDLTNKGVDSCKPLHVEALRQAVFASTGIKELAVIGPNGNVLCTDLGLTTGRRDLVASAATSSPEIMLDVVRINDHNDRLLRVRKLPANGKPALAASLLASSMLPRILPDGTPFSGFARMTLADGTLIGATGTEVKSPTDAAERITSRLSSVRFGPVMGVEMMRDELIASYSDLRRVSMVIFGMIALAILACALIIPWRQRNNPIAEIERGLARDEFIPFFQPIVDITSGKLLGAEVLVRWRKPDGTIVSPAAFIPIVELNGQVIDLTRGLMRRVCQDVGVAIGLRPHVYLAFNTAPRHYNDALILNDVGDIFENAPIKLSQLVLELTERNEIENLSATRRVIAALQGLGCRIAIDDVGTGHSGLSYILKLGVDIIKIDKIFVEAIGTEPHSQAIVGTLVDLAKSMRMKIVAEGVENFEQVVYLREHGISAAQGYVFAPPLPAGAFLKLLETLDPLGQPAAAEVAEVSPEIAAFQRAAVA